MNWSCDVKMLGGTAVVLLICNGVPVATFMACEARKLSEVLQDAAEQGDRLVRMQSEDIPG